MRLSQRVTGGIVLFASLLALGFATVTGIQSREFARCQAQIYEQLVTAQNARASAAAQDRAAMDQLVQDVSNAKSPADSRAALQRYRDTRATTDAERTRNPLPEPPSKRCG